MLTFRDIELGIQECRLNLDLLYPDKSSRGRFERKWGEFFTSDPTHPEVFRREEDGILVFRTESLIPLKSSGRPSVLLLLGNPASHSVHSGMFFSYEGKNREHRFWIALRETGFCLMRNPVCKSTCMIFGLFVLIFEKFCSYHFTNKYSRLFFVIQSTVSVLQCFCRVSACNNVRRHCSSYTRKHANPTVAADRA